MAIFKNKKIIVGVTGSIAAYKSPLLVRELVKAGAHVHVIMTPSARQFVTALTMENLSRNQVAVDMFDEAAQSGGAWHIQLAHWADAMIIAPCSATTLSRIATGLCDTALTTVATALPAEIPLLIAPSMDSTMWLNPATQRNIATLKQDKHIVIPPAEGALSSGLTGPGRLPETDELIRWLSSVLGHGASAPEQDAGLQTDDINVEITDKASSAKDTAQSAKDTKIEVEYVKSAPEKTTEQKIKEALETPMYTLQDAVDKDKIQAELDLDKMKNAGKPLPLTGKNVIITAGPTYEKIDDVRYIANHSSGKMGYALAEAAREQGARVTLISGPVDIVPPANVDVIKVRSAADMYEAVTRVFPSADIAIMAAAVADFTPEAPADGKIKKDDSGDGLQLNLKRTKDILATLGQSKQERQYLVGFALESANELEYGWAKMQKKNADMIVVNSATKPRSGFGGDDNTITILKRDGSQQHFGPESKKLCALRILGEIEL